MKKTNLNRFIISFILILLSQYETKAQTNIGSISHQQDFKYGNTLYTIDIKFQYKLKKLQTKHTPKNDYLGIDMKILNMQILNIKYKGEDTRNFTRIKYPILINNPKIDVEMNDYYFNKENNKSYSDVHKKFYGITNSFYGNYHNAGLSIGAYSKIGYPDINSIEVEFKNIKIISISATDQIYNISDKLREIYSLKKDIDNSNNLEALKKKRNIYVQLEKIEEKSYAKEIAEIDRKIALLKKGETSKDKKDSETIIDSKKNNNTNSENKQKTKQKTYQDYINESNKKIDEVNKKSEQTAKNIMSVGKNFAKGFQDGTFNSIRLSIGTRSFNDSEDENGDLLYSGILNSITYEIGFGIGKGEFSVGGTYNNGFIGIIGLNYDLFDWSPNVNTGRKVSLIKLGVGAEVGFGSYDEEEVDLGYGTLPSTNETLTYYSPGVYIYLLNDLLYFSYNYGWTTGTRIVGSNTEEKLNYSYNKLGFGININF